MDPGRQFVRARMLHREDAREAPIAPTVDHPIQHPRFVWRIGKRDVVLARLERRREGKGIAFEDPRSLAQS